MEILGKILVFAFLVIQALAAIYLLIPFVLLMLHSFRPRWEIKIDKKYPVLTNKEFDFAAIVTAHRDLRFIPPLVDSFCKQVYTRFVVYVVADDCDITGLTFKDPRIRIIRPESPLNSKIKSIKYAVDQFVRPHDVLVVFDSDNLVHPRYFENLNLYFRRGFLAVQTHMLSKNTDTIYAKLDSIGHIYNTFVERQAKMELGLSSSILGLGIAIDAGLYRQVIYKDSLGGFDKKLQADLILAIPRLGFAENAVVYDEKVDDGLTLEKQRTRWIYTYFKYFPVNWKLFVNGWKKMNFNIIFFGFSVLRPPLFIMIGSAFLFLVADFFIQPVLSFVWLCVLLCFVSTFLIIIKTQSRQKGIFKAVLYIPAIVIRQISALFKMKKASRDFLKTEHINVVYIEDLLKNETI
jgi:cellulose synthase/poly-beta-1,6-N-acetylglucosamine synthase-like glycosyltransferase